MGGRQRELQDARRKAHQEQLSQLCREAFDAGPQDLIRVAQYAVPIAMVSVDRETSFDVDGAMAGHLGACPEVRLDSDMRSALRLAAGLDQHRYARVRHAMAHLGRTAGERFQAGCLSALGYQESRGSALICPDNRPYRLTAVRPGHVSV